MSDTTTTEEVNPLVSNITLDIESTEDGNVSIKFSGLTEEAFDFILVSVFGQDGADRIALATMEQIYLQLTKLDDVDTTEAARA